MDEKAMSLNEKLSRIQNELKAPKGQYNSFGKYKYRSCEDILEAIKPICKKYRTTLLISDDVEMIGERYYIIATAQLLDWDSHNILENNARARESYNKKGMDESQITGTASSYARKYALGGMFCIDDTKDADTDEYHGATANTNIADSTSGKSRNEKIKYIYYCCRQHEGYHKYVKAYLDGKGLKKPEQLLDSDLDAILKHYENCKKQYEGA